MRARSVIVGVVVLSAVLATAACSLARSPEGLPEGAGDLNEIRTTFVAVSPGGEVLVAHAIDDDNLADRLELRPLEGTALGEPHQEFALPGESTFYANGGDVSTGHVSAAVYDVNGNARILAWATTGDLVGDFAIDIGDADVTNLAVATIVSDDPAIVVGRNMIGELAAWDLASGEQLFRRLWGPGIGPFWIGDGKAVFSYYTQTNSEVKVAIVDVRDGSTVWETTIDGEFDTLAASAGSGRFAVIADSAVQFWDRTGSELGPRVELPDGDYAAGFAPDGELLTVTSRENELLNIRAGGSAVAAEGDWGSDLTVVEIDWSPDGVLLGNAARQTGQFWRTEGVIAWRPAGG